MVLYAADCDSQANSEYIVACCAPLSVDGQPGARLLAKPQKLRVYVDTLGIADAARGDLLGQVAHFVYAGAKLAHLVRHHAPDVGAQGASTRRADPQKTEICAQGTRNSRGIDLDGIDGPTLPPLKRHAGGIVA